MFTLSNNNNNNNNNNNHNHNIIILIIMIITAIIINFITIRDINHIISDAYTSYTSPTNQHPPPPSLNIYHLHPPPPPNQRTKTKQPNVKNNQKNPQKTKYTNILKPITHTHTHTHTHTPPPPPPPVFKLSGGNSGKNTKIVSGV